MPGYPDALTWLYRHQARGIHPGLDRMRRLLAELDDPQDAFAAFHVGGTNGKGSTAALIEAALRTEGYRTGLYLSPHVTRFAERVQIEGREASPERLARSLDRVRDAAHHLAQQDVHLTFFELVTAAAFHAFRDAGVDVAAVEVGLGGRWDATAVVDPVVAVVTNVGRDHMDRLGPTAAKIAAEKAGILRPGRPVVTGADGVALDVVRRHAEQHGAPMTVEDGRTTRIVSETLDGTSFETDAWGRRRRIDLALAGRHQVRNATLAVRALEQAGRFRVLPEAALEGFASVRLPGRLERVGQAPTWLLDGAHNPEAMRALVACLRRVAPDRRTHLVFGMLADKDLDGTLDALTALQPTMRVVDVPNVRTRAAGDVVDAARDHGLDAQAFDLEDALTPEDEPAVYVVAGSLFLVGHVRRRLLSLAPDPVPTPIYQ